MSTDHCRLDVLADNLRLIYIHQQEIDALSILSSLSYIDLFVSMVFFMNQYTGRFVLTIVIPTNQDFKNSSISCINSFR